MIKETTETKQELCTKSVRKISDEHKQNGNRK